MRNHTSLLWVASVIILGVGALGISELSKAESTSNQWFRGGTLHDATLGEWSRANNHNKLATAGDWLSSTLWKGELKSPKDFDTLKLRAQKLVNAIDQVAAGQVQQANSLNAREIAAAIITMSNDLGP